MAYPDFTPSTFALVLYNWKTTTRDHGDADLESLYLTLTGEEAIYDISDDVYDFRHNVNDHDEWAPFFMDTTDPDAEDRWNALMTDENIEAAISIYYYMLQLIWLPAHRAHFTHLTD